MDVGRGGEGGEVRMGWCGCWLTHAAKRAPRGRWCIITNSSFSEVLTGTDEALDTRGQLCTMQYDLCLEDALLFTRGMPESAYEGKYILYCSCES